MPSRLLMVAIVLGLAAAVFAAGFGTGALWTHHSAAIADTTARATADRAVCSHVQPGPLGASGDWRSPEVANVAYFQASQQIRDAYTEAAATSIPLGATPDQMQVVMTALGKLGNVCAAVNARG